MSTIGRGATLLDQNGNPVTSFPVTQAVPTAANVLDGSSVVTAVGTTTLITVPAGKTWIGVAGVSVSAQNPANTATGTVSAAAQTTGAGVTPPSGADIVGCDVVLDATAATSLNGVNGSASQTTSRLVIVAPAGNSVTLSLVVATTGVVTGLKARAHAIGELQ